MAEAAISSLVKLLGDVVIEKVKSLRGVAGKVRSLKQEVEMMQAFLKDANQKQFKDERVRQWISEIRELAQDAEDTIEMFVVNVENKRNEGLLKKCVSFPKSVNHLARLGNEIDSILKDLEAIERRRIAYGIKDLGEAAAVDTAPVERRRRQIEQRTVGLEDDVRELLQKSILNEGNRGLSIAVVAGMGGIGKSTLARKIYNHPDVVRGPFERRVWVVVSSEFTPQETIKQLILELGGPREEIRKLEEDFKKNNLHLQEKLKEMLRKQLEAKAYFIVLDDVWEVDHWETLKDAFPTNTPQGRLLITTRNSQMSKYGQYSHEMKLLSPEKSWELFINNALVDGKCPENLEGVGRQIVEKCNGLPLAISVVGGLLLGTQSNISAWKQVMDSLLEIGESIVLSILELSYLNLSPQLKSCFMCLAFFKEDEIISATRLMHIWIGQGLIQQQGRVRAEEIGRGYLDKLINLNMVLIKDLTLGRRVKTCQVHDLVRVVCLRKAEEEIGLEILKAEKQNTSTSIELSSWKPRHCVARSDNLVSFSSQHNKHLRSLFVVDDGYFLIHELRRKWKSFKLLKMIEVDVRGLKKLPSCFRTLIGLKYLRLPGGWNIHFSRWLEDLKKLEVIDVESGIVTFPEDEWFKYSPKLIGSCRIRELGIHLNSLKNRSSWMQPLFEMNENRFSRIQQLLEKMDNLVKLEIKCYVPVNVASFIPQVGNCLTKLILKGPLVKCPSANAFPPMLSHLTFKKSYLLEDPMTELGKLPNLVSLNLSSWAYIGERMKVLRDGFPILEALSLKGLSLLKSIDIEEGGMPHLTHLRIHKCDALHTVQNMPKQITISHIM